MKRNQIFGLLAAAAALMALTVNIGTFEAAPGSDAKFDWPQWRGPNRDGVSKEIGLLKSWPEGGPKVLWRAPAGEGYSGIAVSQGRAFTMYGEGNDEVTVGLDAANGKEIWRFRADGKYINDQGNGPRSTPTVDGDLVFTLSGNGTLHALNAKDGKKVWEHNLTKEFAGRIPTWGISTSPLVEGELLIVDVGGKAEHSVVAFNKSSGSLAWKSQTDQPGYSAPIAVTVNGVRQVLVFTGTALVSLSPANGKLFWRYPWVTEFFVNAATPVFIPNDKIFISSGYGKGAALLQMQAANGRVTAAPVWLSRAMKNHFSSSVFHEGHLYGFDDAIFKCLDANTGGEKWKARGFQKGSLILADGHLIVLGEHGNLALVEATPTEYKEKANVPALKGKCWTMPSLAGGKLYLRNEKEMLCLDVTGKSM
jgi:outer membrane protein assembly factor BamB